MGEARNAGRLYRGLVIAALLASAPCARAADAGATPAPGSERAVTLESVPGSTIKRVVLSPKALERLDVKTGAVGEEAIVPTLMVGGVVADPSAAGGASASPAGGGSKAPAQLWVRVGISPPEWDRLAKDKPARVFPLATRGTPVKDLVAAPSGRPPLDNAKSGMLSVFYVLPPDAAKLALGDRVRVELPLAGASDKQKVVPYSAVYYDAKGDAWVYVSTGPFAFVRERITVVRVAGDLAVLSSGPAVGTPVVTVGVSLLYGAEIFGK